MILCITKVQIMLLYYRIRGVKLVMKLQLVYYESKLLILR
jgi:hypothetical protein